MLGRARRLKEIADSNQPAFDLTQGTQWWLEEASNKPNRSQSASSPSSGQAVQPDLNVSRLQIAETPSAAKEVSDAQVPLSDYWRTSEPESPKPESSEKPNDRLAWDPKAACFVTLGLGELPLTATRTP